MNKKLLYRSPLAIFILYIILSACNGPDKKAGTTDVENIVIDQPDTVLFWTVDDYNKIKTQVYKDTAGITDPGSVINGINSIYPKIHLRFLNLSNDTVYAKIDSAFAFTDDMGSFGATEYLSTVVLNLTTLQNINYVNLDFPVGSHASPGVFAKNDYQDYKEKDQ